MADSVITLQEKRSISGKIYCLSHFGGGILLFIKEAEIHENNDVM